MAGDGTRMSELPRVIQPAARLIRAALPDSLVRRLPGRFVWVYKGDGLATVHYSPFLYDGDFEAVYRKVADRWPGRPPIDMRWRMWFMTECARQCASLPGGLAEFGVYRGGSAFLILSRAGLRTGQTMYLFDTFAGIPPGDLTETEVSSGFEGRLSDTSEAAVAALLEPWKGRVVLVAGDVLATLPATDTGPLAFAHLDLNAARPTLAALDYAYHRLVPRGMLVFDDYGWPGYEDQRRVIDTFFGDKDEVVLALPTGQGLVVKL